VPLPGGVTYIRRDLIRSRGWQIATSTAGPAMNFLLFLLLALPFHPKIGLITPPPLGQDPSNAQMFIGGMAWLQMLSVLLNLVPVPPLDGYQIVEQFLDEDTRWKIRSMGTTIFFIYFLVLWQVPHAFGYFHHGVEHTLELLGFDDTSINLLGQYFNRVLFGHA
jgi:Zn-dependent protease